MVFYSPEASSMPPVYGPIDTGVIEKICQEINETAKNSGLSNNEVDIIRT